jgi:hypothetical protein
LSAAGFSNYLANPLPNGRNLPPGSYLEQCDGCSLVHQQTILSCTHCPTYQNRGHIDGVSSIAVSKCQLFGFINGKLDCDVVSDGSTLPPGTYQNSCNNCHVVGYYVWCAACMDKDGGVGERTQLDYRGCKSIGNSHGKLMCDDECNNNANNNNNNEHAKRSTKIFLDSNVGMPTGNYHSSCVGCTVLKDHTTLLPVTLSCALCRGGENNGPSSITLLGCRYFSALKGRLICEDEDLVPVGETKIAPEAVQAVPPSEL